jgi:cytoskeletal protein RodZ
MKKEKIVTLGLILMMIFLIGAIFYFSYLLMEAPTEEKTTSAVAPKKTKAQVATSEKFIALNQNTSSNPSPTSYLPTSTPTQTPTDNLVTKETPTPTEIILAKAETPTPLPSNNYYLSPTKITTLPTSGAVHSILILFGVAAFFILYSLLF